MYVRYANYFFSLFIRDRAGHVTVPSRDGETPRCARRQGRGMGFEALLAARIRTPEPIASATLRKPDGLAAPRSPRTAPSLVPRRQARVPRVPYTWPSPSWTGGSATQTGGGCTVLSPRLGIDAGSAVSSSEERLYIYFQRP